MYYDHFKSAIGIIYVSASSTHLTEVSFIGTDQINPNTITNAAIAQLKQYFKGELKCFDLPLQIEGTSYSKEIYTLMQKIPYGEVSSYKELASKSSSVKAYRRVGSICGINRFMIIVPCHRVLLANGDLGNYAHGIEVKRKLLNLEYLNNI